MSNIKEQVETIVRNGFPKADRTLIKEGGRFRIRGFDHEKKVVKIMADFPRPCRHPGEYAADFGEKMEGLMDAWDEHFGKNVAEPVAALGYTVDMSA